MKHLTIYVYGSALFGCCGFAAFRGGRAERAGAAINLMGTALSVIAARSPSHTWQGTMLATWGIDAAVCLASLILMVATRRTWTIPHFGFAAAETASHAARSLQLSLPAIAYYNSEAKWAYGMLLAVAVGTWQTMSRCSRRSSAQDRVRSPPN